MYYLESVEELDIFKVIGLIEICKVNRDYIYGYALYSKEDFYRTFEELLNKDNRTAREEKELVMLSLDAKGNYLPDGFNSGGYDWCCSNWGSKWGISDSSLPDEEYDEKVGKLFYGFQSAWSPVGPLIIKMSEMFPKLLFNYKYYEGGGGFRGIFICKAGNVKKSKQYDYKGWKGG